jgi:putative endonuclease
LAAQLASKLRAIQRGQRAEAFVAARLAADGWRILARNWRGGGGELDLVASRAEILRFVEVKAPRYRNFDPLGRGQRDRIYAAAQAYTSAVEVSFNEVYFSLALVGSVGTHPVIEWIEDAFDGVEQCHFG